MFCSKCGQKIPSGAAFCPNCGARVQAEEPARPSVTPSDAAAKAEPAQPVLESAAQTGSAPSAFEKAAQPTAAPFAGPSVPPAPQPAPDNPQPSGDPLAAMVGKHTDYYLAEFKKIDAGQKPRFNWAEFLLGPVMCFYRRSGELFKKYFLFVYVALAVSSLILMVGMSSFNGLVAAIGAVLALAACVWGLVNAIRFGRNFNRDYYAHCKQQLAKPAVGASAVCKIALDEDNRDSDLLLQDVKVADHLISISLDLSDIDNDIRADHDQCFLVEVGLLAVEGAEHRQTVGDVRVVGFLLCAHVCREP